MQRNTNKPNYANQFYHLKRKDGSRECWLLLIYAMAKNRLVNEDYFNFELLGIVTTVKEYKLVWHLNQALGLDLTKQPDIMIEFSGNNRFYVSNFMYKTEFLHVSLLKNRLVVKANSGAQHLLEELKQFDYLLKYHDQTEQTNIKDVLSLLKSTVVVEYAAILAPELIKSRDNLIF